MVWTQAEPSVWVDKYDGAEKAFFNMSQAFKHQHKEHGSVYLICRLRTPAQHDIKDGRFETHLRYAWRRLRIDFPSLAVFERDGSKTYISPTNGDRDINDWVRDTFWADNHAASAKNVLPDLHLRKLPCLVFISRSCEILLHSSHWRIDALGACMVIERFLDLLSDSITAGKTVDPSRWALAFQNLSPSLEDAYGSSSTSTPATSATAEAIRVRNFDEAFPSAGLPFRGGPETAPGPSRSRAVRLSTAETKSLVAACKKREISVTAAVHAACSAAVFDRAADRSCDSYSTVVSVNLRGLLRPSTLQPAPRRVQQHAVESPPPGGNRCVCGTYVTGITHTLRRGDDFATQSRQLTSAYRRHGSPGDEAREYMNALRTIYHVHGRAMADLAGKRVMSNVTVSSLGVVDGSYLHSDHGAVQVEDFQLGSAILTRQPTLYIWTFKGSLALSIDYNEAYYDAGDMLDLLESITMHLSKNLDISLSAAT